VAETEVHDQTAFIPIF